ncbi:MAG: hypothetical protein IJS60_10955 [Abditibacteriota bacterium]|nr:hypothetical protein [Abditibacteriota bacterium]
MKKTLLLLLVLLFALSVTSQAQKKTNNSTIPKPLKYAEGVNKCEEDIDILTQDKIVKIIRDFMKDESLSGFEIEKHKIPNYETLEHTLIPNEYMARIDNLSWGVNLVYDIVILYLYSDRDVLQNTNQFIPIEECLINAIDWLNDKQIPLFGYKINEGQLFAQKVEFDRFFPDVHYYFTFKHRTDKGLDTSDFINVQVYKQTGKVGVYTRNTNNIKVLSDGFLPHEQFVDIVKSFFTEEETKGCNLKINSYPAQIVNYPIDSQGSRKYITIGAIACNVFGEQNSDLGMGIKPMSSGETEQSAKKNDYVVSFTFDAYNGYLYSVANMQNGSLIPNDVREKIDKYKNSIKQEPQKELKEYPFELLTVEKLKEIKPTPEDIELVLFKDNSDIKKFSQKDCGIEGLTKFENTEDIYTYTKDDNVYIFREGSPWCLVNNKTLLVSNCPVIKK